MDMQTYFLNRKRNAENIKDKIIDTLNKQGIKVDGRVEYNGSAICIEHKNLNIWMWLRLMWNETADKCTIYMSNIKFTPKYQRKGIFTNIINMLKRNKYIDNIVIQSVSSDSMRNWCKKHRFIEDEHAYNFYWKMHSM